MKNSIRLAILRSYRSLAARPSFRHFNELLFDCAVRGLGILNYEDDYVSGEHHFVNRILPSRIQRDNPLFVDVGANVGNYCLGLLKRFPNSSILAVEPQPLVFTKLKSAVHAWTNVIPINMGLGSSEGELTLFNYSSGDHSEHASLYREVFTDLRPSNVQGISVKIQRLDKLMNEYFPDRAIDLLKIDTEGHELEVLLGCDSLLSMRRIENIQLEFNDVNAISGVFLRDIRKLLSDFDVFRLLPGGLLPISEVPLRSELFAFQNLLFTRKRAV